MCGCTPGHPPVQVFSPHGNSQQRCALTTGPPTKSALERVCLLDIGTRPYLTKKPPSTKKRNRINLRKQLNLKNRLYFNQWYCLTSYGIPDYSQVHKYKQTAVFSLPCLPVEKGGSGGGTALWCQQLFCQL